MNAASQREIDRETIQAFEELWRETVINGTGEAVKRSVAEAIAELGKAARNGSEQVSGFAEHMTEKMRDFDELDRRIREMIGQNEGAAAAVAEFTRKAPDMSRQLVELQTRVQALTSELQEDASWQRRLRHWQKDRRLRALLGQFAAEASLRPAATDVGEVPPQADPVEQDGDRPGAIGLAVPVQRPRPNGSSDPSIWRKLTGALRNPLAAVVALIAGVVIGLFLARALQPSPIAASPAPASAVAEQGGPDPTLTASADAEWKAFRLDEANAARLRDLCGVALACATDAGAIDQGFETAWSGLTQDRQHRLFTALVASVKGPEPLTAAQCATLVAGPELETSAPEFTQQIARCMVRVDFARGAEPIADAELLAVATRLLAFRHDDRARDSAARGADEAGSADPDPVPPTSAVP